MSEDRAAIRRTFVEMVRDEYPNAGDGIISLFDAALAATPTPRQHPKCSCQGFPGVGHPHRDFCKDGEASRLRIDSRRRT